MRIVLWCQRHQKYALYVPSTYARQTAIQNLINIHLRHNSLIRFYHRNLTATAGLETRETLSLCCTMLLLHPLMCHREQTRLIKLSM
jgi:hypothetical protein